MANATRTAQLDALIEDAEFAPPKPGELETIANIKGRLTSLVKGVAIVTGIPELGELDGEAKEAQQDMVAEMHERLPGADQETLIRAAAMYVDLTGTVAASEGMTRSRMADLVAGAWVVLGLIEEAA